MPQTGVVMVGNLEHLFLESTYQRHLYYAPQQRERDRHWKLHSLGFLYVI
jgi:hypothetical protein